MMCYININLVTNMSYISTDANIYSTEGKHCSIYFERGVYVVIINDDKYKIVSFIYYLTLKKNRLKHVALILNAFIFVAINFIIVLKL